MTNFNISKSSKLARMLINNQLLSTEQTDTQLTKTNQNTRLNSLTNTLKIENNIGKLQSSFLSPFTNRVTPKLAKGSYGRRTS